MGINIENGNELTKYYSDMQDSLVKAMKEKSLRISTVEKVDYKISQIMASSSAGKKLFEAEEEG